MESTFSCCTSEEEEKEEKKATLNHEKLPLQL